MWGIFISISAKFGFLFCFVWQGCFPHPGRKGLRDRSKSGWSNFHLDSEQHVGIFAGEVHAGRAGVSLVGLVRHGHPKGCRRSHSTLQNMRSREGTQVDQPWYVGVLSANQT